MCSVPGAGGSAIHRAGRGPTYILAGRNAPNESMCGCCLVRVIGGVMEHLNPKDTCLGCSRKAGVNGAGVNGAAVGRWMPQEGTALEDETRSI